MSQKISRWMDSSVILRGILWLFNAFLAICRGSFVVSFFSADYDGDKLRRSRFVRAIEGVLNFFPKILKQQSNFKSSTKGALKNNAILNSVSFRNSAVIRYLTETMDTPIPETNSIAGWAKWAFAAFPVWGMMLIVVGVPFLPTMVLGGLLVAIFVAALFRERFELDLAGVALVFFMGVSLIAGAASLSRETSIRIAVLVIILMSSYLLIQVCFKKLQTLDFVLGAFVAAAGLTGLVALYQWVAGYTIEDGLVDARLHAEIQFRAWSTFDNSNVYGTFLVLMIPLSIALIFYARRILLKICAAGITLLLLAALGLTFSRGSYVAVAVAVALFVLILERRAIVLFVGGLFVLPFVLPTAVLNRLLSILDFTDSSTMYRLAIYRGALRLLGDFWMFGIGQGVDAYNRAAPLHALAGVHAAHSHNLFLQIFLETGIVGFLAFMVVLALFFHGQFSFMRKAADSRRRILSAAMTSAVVGFLVMGLFDFPFHNYSVMLAFFLFLGLASAVTSAGEES
ncbi:MAG: O-antigen ligase family protein [Defluviitaleaceae bacterium]|nr:O-antigen ligase family protein [Defluviitaleaceae bacterium]